MTKVPNRTLIITHRVVTGSKGKQIIINTEETIKILTIGIITIIQMTRTIQELVMIITETIILIITILIIKMASIKTKTPTIHSIEIPTISIPISTAKTSILMETQTKIGTSILLTWIRSVRTKILIQIITGPMWRTSKYSICSNPALDMGYILIWCCR